MLQVSQTPHKKDVLHSLPRRLSIVPPVVHQQTIAPQRSERVLNKPTRDHVLHPVFVGLHEVAEQLRISLRRGAAGSGSGQDFRLYLEVGFIIGLEIKD